MEKNVRQRLIVFLVVLIAAILFLLPTFFREGFVKPWISKPLSLGLDLKGGVYLVYEVVTSEAVKSRLLNIVQTIRSDLRDEKIATTKAVVNDKNQMEITLLSVRAVDKARDKIKDAYPNLIFVEQLNEGERVKLVYRISEGEAQRIEHESVRQAVETLRNRVDQFGVAEPLIQQVGLKRILLEMPGISDIESVKKIVGKTAKLEFRLVPVGRAEAAENWVKLKDRSGAPVYVEDQALMTGDAVDTARVGTHNGQVEVDLSLTSDGARTFKKITSENVGRQLAIILDNVVYSSPVIRETIGGGRASITGGFTFEEATQLAMVLRAGALPAPLEVMEERTVGPTLGRESIRQGVIASIVGFVLIMIFMMVYYGKSGALASGSLVLNLFLLLAALSAFGATLTLPGLAGLALTAGMAVDSNVIIFERIRDEIKNGAGRMAAVRGGFDKAWSAIIDSNLTTLASALVLYVLGSGPIRGFAVTLSIGIATTIYCAVFVTHLGFDVLELKGKERELSV